MCCLLRGCRRNKDPPRPLPPHRLARHRHHHHQAELPSRGSSSSLGSSAAGTSSSLPTDFSSTSTCSIASIKDIIPDGPLLYRFPDICVATANFDPASQVSRSVWRASLGNTLVAISRQHGPSGHHPFTSHGHFKSVLARIHALHHQSLVKLLGACREGDYLFLVYEFFESSNLRDCLRSKLGVRFSALSSWLSRIQVAVDVAKGLEYLHHLSSPALIHKCIDSSNILVGNDLRAKIAHVGVAVLRGEVDFLKGKLPDPVESIPENGAGEIQPVSSNRRASRSRSIKISGIQGYMPPEYLSSGVVSPKYDVFAFGVVLAEILSGQQAASSLHEEANKPRRPVKSVSLPDLLHSVMTGDDSKSKLRRWMDPLLRDSFPLEDAYKVASIALACMDPDPLKRPDMSDVALRLQKLLLSAEKYHATVVAQQELLTVSLQPR